MVTQTDYDLKLDAYDFELPSQLIASRPIPGRHNSRLLVYNQANDEIIHGYFKDLDKFLPEKSTLILNQSKVFPCRLMGKKKTGGKAEIFLLTPIANEQGEYQALIRTTNKKHIGDQFFFAQNVIATIQSIDEQGHFYISFNREDISSWLEEHALVPIPPYIRDGISDDKDREDYQTVYAKHLGSVAAPTAGLHFTQDVFQKLKQKEIDPAYVTLHVGLGTFAPVKADNLMEHKMHSERFFVEKSDLQKIQKAKKRFAVGTTSLRVLESICGNNLSFDISPEHVYETDIFLYPGKNVRSIDGLITNFHLPKSSLIMLVSALIGRTKTLELYKEAIEKEYRFFSYGDAMLILRAPE